MTTISKKKKNKLALGFVTSEEFLSRAAMIDASTNRGLYGSDRTRYTNLNGGALFVAGHETKAQVKKFFESLERFGVEIQCEHNAQQPNYADSIRLFIPKLYMLRVMSEMVRSHPGGMHIVSDTVADFWWD